MPRYQVVHSLSKITMIVAAVALSGIGAGDERFGDTGEPVERLSRPFGIGLWQIERFGCASGAIKADSPPTVFKRDAEIVSRFPQVSWKSIAIVRSSTSRRGRCWRHRAGSLLPLVTYIAT
jgi:hypothetical protein